MTENTEQGAGPGQRAVELGTAAMFAAFGVAIAIGSLQVGIGWGAEGPKSGFFPFLIAIAIVAASTVAAAAARRVPADKLFAEWAHLRLVWAVVWPTAVYCAAIPYVGLYVCSAALIAGFMVWLDKYKPLFSIGIALAVVVATFAVFERWFLVPLPKGPIEDWLGL